MLMEKCLFLTGEGFELWNTTVSNGTWEMKLAMAVLTYQYADVPGRPNTNVRQPKSRGKSVEASKVASHRLLM
jgi:hypothetical protein